MAKRMLDCVTSDFVTFKKEDWLSSISGSEGRVIACESIGTVLPMLGNITNAEFTASMGADILLLNIFDVQDPVIQGLPKVKPEDCVCELKRLTGRMVGINLEPVEDNAGGEDPDNMWKMSPGRRATVENAVKESLKEMQVFYSDDAAILRELEIMVRQIRVQVPVEQAVEELSERTKLPDVESFAGVFVTAKRSGGNLMSIIRNTADQIGDKIDVKREIDTMLAAKKYEFQVMSVIPFGIVLYMTVSFPEFMGNLYGNIAGRGVMTGCLIIYLGAYGLGRKIIEIEV